MWLWSQQLLKELWRTKWAVAPQTTVINAGHLDENGWANYPHLLACSTFEKSLDSQWSESSLIQRSENVLASTDHKEQENQISYRICEWLSLQGRLESRQHMLLVLPFGNLSPLFLDLHFFKRSKVSIVFCLIVCLFGGVKSANFRILGNNPAFFPWPKAVQAALSGLDRTYLVPHLAQGLSAHNLWGLMHGVGILRGKRDGWLWSQITINALGIKPTSCSWSTDWLS